MNMQNITNTGFIPSHDYRDAHKDLIMGAETPVKLKATDFSDSLVKAFQYSKPFCTSYSVAKYISYRMLKDSGDVVDLSEDGLARLSGTSVLGNTFQSVFGTAFGSGVWLQPDFPNFGITVGSVSEWNKLMKVPEEKLALLKSFKEHGYWRINTDAATLAQELQTKPLIFSFGIGETFNTEKEIVEPPKTVKVLHASVLAGWHPVKGYKVHDSLMRPPWSGEYYLAPEYEILSAYEITKAIPANWKDLQEQAQKNEFQFCLDHYGMRRDIEKEQLVAGQMVKAFRAFNNESVWQAAGKFWTVYINAIVYGGYNLEYTKFFKWQPGDIINDCYNWRRTGRHLFNFNLLRNQQ